MHQYTKIENHSAETGKWAVNRDMTHSWKCQQEI